MNGKVAATQLWQERFERFDAAELSVREFCEREGVSQASYYYWRKRLAGGSAVVSPQSRSAFQSVRVTSVSSAMVIALPGGVRLEVAADQLEMAQVVVRELALVTQAGGARC